MIAFSALRQTHPTPPPGQGRLAFVLLLLAAFFLQGFALQVHLHGLDGTGQPTADGLYAPDRDGGDGPLSDRIACPICQASLHAGQYLASAGPSLPPLSFAAAGAIAAAAQLAVRPHSHIWQGRAPPADR